jgi:hypothetical protein
VQGTLEAGGTVVRNAGVWHRDVREFPSANCLERNVEKAGWELMLGGGFLRRIARRRTLGKICKIEWTKDPSKHGHIEQRREEAASDDGLEGNPGGVFRSEGGRHTAFGVIRRIRSETCLILKKRRGLGCRQLSLTGSFTQPKPTMVTEQRQKLSKVRSRRRGAWCAEHASGRQKDPGRNQAQDRSE